MKIEFFSDTGELSRAAASNFLGAAAEAISAKGKFRAALSGGTGPRGLFAELARQAHAIDWAKVELYWVDERWVPWDSPESNFGEAGRLWLDGFGAKPALFPMWAPGQGPESAAQAYGALLQKNLGAGGFDWCQLGMGPDGHTASLFPGQASLSERKRCCLAVKHPQSGQDRVTLSLPWLNASLSVVFLVSGPGKAALLERIAAGSTQLPAALVKPGSGEPLWLAQRP